MKLLGSAGSSFAVSSSRQAQVVLRNGVTPERISYFCRNSRESDIAEVFELGVRIFSVTSVTEVQKVARVAPQSQIICRIRLYTIRRDKDDHRQSGCDPEFAPELLDLASRLALRPVGVSFHLTAQDAQSEESWDRAISLSAAIFRSCAERGVGLSTLNFGGDFLGADGEQQNALMLYGRLVFNELRRHFGNQIPETTIEWGYRAPQTGSTTRPRQYPSVPLPKELSESIETAAEGAPKISYSRGRFRYEETKTSGSIAERKHVVQERCSELQALCSRRSNESPELQRLVDRYASNLSSLRRVRGGYKLHLAGLDIESYIRTKSQLPSDPESNPPLAHDILFASQSLLLAHAGLIVLFPDISRIADELAEYRQQFSSIDALRERLLDPVLSQLSQARGILDEKTKDLTEHIAKLDTGALDTVPSQIVAGTKHSWLRGILAAVGRFAGRHASEIAKVARDATVRETVSAVAKHPFTTVTAIATFIVAAQPALLRISEMLPAAFGWIKSLLSFLGIG